MKQAYSIACVIAIGTVCAPPAAAVDVVMVGRFTNKVVVQIDGGPPRTLSLNQTTADGVTLLSVARDSATFSIDGRNQVLKMGQAHSPSMASSRNSVTLAADAQGHYTGNGQINGVAVRFVVDTGATLIALSSSDAERIGLRYLEGRPGMVNTANGKANAWQVKLDTVRIGNVSINNVDALVMENQTMPVLLGMSFLNRMEMQRDGSAMILTKRF